MQSSSSGDEVLIVGFPAAGSVGDSDDDYGGVLREESDVSVDKTDQSSDEVLMAVAPRRTRNRPRRQVERGGGFWAFVTQEKAEDEGRQHIFGFVYLRWELTEPDYSIGESTDHGLLSYVADKICLLQAFVAFPLDADITAGQACLACADSALAEGRGTVSTCLGGEAALCRFVVACTHAEVTALRGVGAEAPMRFRSLPVHSRGDGGGRGVAVGTVGQPSKAVLRRWRRQIRDAYADQAIPLPEDAPMEVDPAPRQPGPDVVPARDASCQY